MFWDNIILNTADTQSTIMMKAKLVNFVAKNNPITIPIIANTRSDTEKAFNVGWFFLVKTTNKASCFFDKK